MYSLWSMRHHAQGRPRVAFDRYISILPVKLFSPDISGRFLAFKPLPWLKMWISTFKLLPWLKKVLIRPWNSTNTFYRNWRNLSRLYCWKTEIEKTKAPALPILEYVLIPPSLTCCLCPQAMVKRCRGVGQDLLRMVQCGFFVCMVSTKTLSRIVASNYSTINGSQ